MAVSPPRVVPISGQPPTSRVFHTSAPLATGTVTTRGAAASVVNEPASFVPSLRTTSYS